MGSLSKITLVFLIFVAGCGTKPAELVFAVGGAPNELDFWETLAADFRKDTGINVRILRQPTDSDQRRQGILIPLKAGKNDPDVFLMDIAWIPQFAASGWLRDLDAAGSGPMDTAPFWKKIIDRSDRHDGKLVALPVYVDAGLLYYRKDLLKKYGASKPPATWEELIAVSLKAQAGMRGSDPGFYAFAWQGAQYEGLVCDFLEFAGAQGGIRTEGGRIAVATPENAKALGLMRDLVNKYKISPPNTYTEMKEEEVRLFFQKGSALFERNWPYAWSLHQADGSPVRDKTGICPLPGFAGSGSVSTLGGWHIGMSKYSDVPENAALFIKYVLSKKVQKELSIKLGWNPARRDVYSDPDVLKVHPHFTQLRRIFDNAAPRPGLPYYTQVSEALQRHLNAAVSGSEEPAAALEAAQKEIDAVAARYGGVK